MSAALAQVSYDWEEIIENIVTEDDEPVDNLFSAKQQTLLKRTLYSSWQPAPDQSNAKTPRQFLAEANVGIFFAVNLPPLVPDFFLALDVAPHQDWFAKAHRSYFVWEFGKLPEVVVEIVSTQKGSVLTSKLKNYAQWGVNYYVVYDPERQLSTQPLRVYEIGFGKRYRLREDFHLPQLKLCLALWQGVFEGKEDTWLRWCDEQGHLILTGEERARQAEAEVEKLRAELARLQPRAAKKSKNK
jgi:hypothetical protein